MTNERLETDKKSIDDTGIQRTEMQKEIVISRLREMGCRITRQRMILLDIILGEECSSCKEIYYKATKQDSRIGAINRKNMYKVACGANCGIEDACVIELDDSSSIELSAKEWNRIIRAGLMAGGYIENQMVTGVNVKPCGCGSCC